MGQAAPGFKLNIGSSTEALLNELIRAEDKVQYDRALRLTLCYWMNGVVQCKCHIFWIRNSA